MNPLSPILKHLIIFFLWLIYRCFNLCFDLRTREYKIMFNYLLFWNSCNWFLDNLLWFCWNRLPNCLGYLTLFILLCLYFSWSLFLLLFVFFLNVCVLIFLFFFIFFVILFSFIDYLCWSIQKLCILFNNILHNITSTYRE